MADMMLRSLWVSTSIALLISLGCGKSEVAVSAPDQADRPGPSQSAEPNANAQDDPSPTDVVSQFLDQIRRGGADSGAGTLLTEKAQSELKRIGRSIEPIGSPDATYRVTRAQAVPGEKKSMLVHSIWSDPVVEGGSVEYQVVWAVERESSGWRISGMAIQHQPDQPPIIIDFENGDLVAQVLAGPPSQADAPPPAQAAVPESSVSR